MLKLYFKVKVVIVNFSKIKVTPVKLNITPSSFIDGSWSIPMLM